MTDSRVVVVDGSNLATEGRTTPSLQQLDDAVRAYAEEDPGAEIVVVVDASFEHRVDASEREALEEAELHGEVVSPPAGAIGRGDAFVLRIAERTSAVVLSNDSFQEFHGEHPWLFDDGRLIGGKPVPGVGWIFTPRIPVRGPKSRQATTRARRSGAAEPLTPSVKAAELAKAARKAATKRMAVLPDGSTPSVGDVWQEPPRPADPAGGGSPAKKTTAKRAKKAAKAVEVAAGETAMGETAGDEAAGEAVQAPAAKVARKVSASRRAAAAAGPEVLLEGDGSGAEPLPVEKAVKKAAKKATDTAVKKAAKKAVEKATDTAVTKTAKRVTTPAKRGGRKALREAIDEATAEALSPSASATAEPGVVTGDGTEEVPDGEHRGGEGQDGKGARRRRRRAATPPPAVNEPLAFITFVATFPMGSELDGEVVSFTSHGAMVDVDLPDGGTHHCYIPLAAMADPPPIKARQVLSRGERRTFVLVGLDPPRRVAELALPGVTPPTTEPGGPDQIGP